MKQRTLAKYLTQKDNLWYYQEELYTGVIFFSKEENCVEPYEVENGKITQPYISWCMKDRPSPIQINSTGFCNEDEDDYGSGMVVQYYQGQIYQGMSYTFLEGKCLREIYTYEKGYTESQYLWDTMTGNVKFMEIDYPFCNGRQVYYENSVDTLIFSHSEFGNPFQLTGYIKFTMKLDMIHHISICGNILDKEIYKGTSNSFPHIFGKSKSYFNLTFSKNISLNIDKDNIDTLFTLWIQNNSFMNVEIMSLNDSFADLNDLSIFSNRNIFQKLEEIHIFSDTTTAEQIKAIREANPNLKITT